MPTGALGRAGADALLRARRGREGSKRAITLTPGTGRPATERSRPPLSLPTVRSQTTVRREEPLLRAPRAPIDIEVDDMDEATLKRWQVIARETAWKDFNDKNESCAGLLKAAQKLL